MEGSFNKGKFEVDWEFRNNSFHYKYELDGITSGTDTTSLSEVREMVHGEVNGPTEYLAKRGFKPAKYKYQALPEDIKKELQIINITDSTSKEFGRYGKGTVGHHTVLGILVKIGKNDGTLPVEKINERNAVVAEAIKKLERHGLVERHTEENAYDYLKWTRKGKKIYKAMYKVNGSSNYQLKDQAINMYKIAHGKDVFDPV